MMPFSSSGFVRNKALGGGPTGTGDGEALSSCKETEELQAKLGDLDLYLKAKNAEEAELDRLWAEHDAFAEQVENVDGEVWDAEEKVEEMNKWMVGCEKIVEKSKVCLDKYWKLVEEVEAADAKDLQFLESVEIKLKEDPKAFFKELGVDLDEEEGDETKGFPYGSWMDLRSMEKMKHNVLDENLQDTCDAIKDHGPVWDVFQAKPMICFRKHKYSCVINIPLHEKHDSLKLTGVGNSYVEAFYDAFRELLNAILGPRDLP